MCPRSGEPTLGTRHKRSSRCIGCRLHPAVCICDTIPSFDLKTRVLLVMHRREFMKTTNTGVLALRALTNGGLVLWGERHTPFAAPELAAPDCRALVLTPTEDAVELNAAWRQEHPGPYTLVVPDGTWRQALKMVRRVPELADRPRVTLPTGTPTRYQLRDETHAGGLATFEAIARALGVLEGEAVQAELEALFERYVGATLRTRGRIPRP